MTFLLIFLVALWAGAQNALAGGGSFLTLPMLMFSGLDARAANITSCVALFPGQIATGWAGRSRAGGVSGLSLRTLFAISVLGGALGAAILLLTPAAFFARLIPWLVLFATGVFVWGSFFRKAAETSGHIGPVAAGIAQFAISVYGVPETFVVRGDGIVAYKFVGPLSPYALEQTLIPEIEKALKPAPRS